MHNLIILLALLGNLLAPLPWLQETPAAEVTGVSAVYDYGEKVIFEGQVQPAKSAAHLFLFIQPEGERTRVESVPLEADGNFHYTYDARQYPLRPFARTDYWFRIVLSDGSEVESGRGLFDYIDNRYTWKTLQGDSFQVNWYEGDMAFGQEALNVAKAGLQSALKYMPAENSKPIRIYIYAAATDMQKALQLSQQSWIAGHASPDLGVILISVPPGEQQRLEFQRQLPHEMAHLLQYAIVGDHYSSVPVWLLEGAASLAELNPNPDYERVLKKATESDSLLAMNTLCSAFPPEASGAFLAYAESASFVRFLHDNFGTSGLENLMQQYKDGLGCEQGVQAAYGLSMRQMEYRWRLELLRVNGLAYALQNLSPYLAILLLLVLPPILSIVIARRIR